MSMPHPKMLMVVGCVVEVKTTKFRSTLIVYRNENEIKALHPYFNTGTNAADILNQTASIVAAPDDDLRITHKSVKVTSKHFIRRIGAKSTHPSRVKGPHRLEDGYYYWLVRR